MILIRAILIALMSSGKAQSQTHSCGKTQFIGYGLIETSAQINQVDWSCGPNKAKTINDTL